MESPSSRLRPCLEIPSRLRSPLHSDEEDRFVTIGVSADFRILVVVHADRERRIRIISARVATKREMKDYEEGI
jgi:uncharacterized DUF497 family protein